MCGIVGITGLVERKLIKDMLNSIKHRGPDEYGFYFDERISLGHCRLSIVDLSAGRQPFFNENGTILAIANSEIYNYATLKHELSIKEHIFRTNCDSEVLVHLYEEYGLRFAEQIEGFFAVAIYDMERDKLVLARDRLGIKPLYYCIRQNRLIFASEMKAIVRSGLLVPRISIQACKMNYAFGYVLDGYTLLDGINQFLPGHTYLWTKGILHKTPFTKVSRLRLPSNSSETLLSLLKRSVKQQSSADVKLGVFLSGGIDSSIIAQIFHEHANNCGQVKAFSINDVIDNRDMPYARLMAKHLGAEHHEFNFGLGDIISEMPLMIYHQENIDYGFIFHYFLCKQSRRYATVALSGCGADELFGGYQRYVEPLREQKKYLENMKASRLQNRKIMEKVSKICSVKQLMDFEIKNGQLANAQLHHVDRTSMAHGMEVRVPYLSQEVLSFANNLPYNTGIDKSMQKAILRNLGKKIGLPSRICNRPKFFAGMNNTSPVSMPQFHKFCYDMACKRKPSKYDKYLVWPTRKIVFDLFSKIFIDDLCRKPDYGLNDLKRGSVC